MPETSERPPIERVAVLIPTYNERENLPLIVARVRECVPDVDVVVLDDNSPDGTGQVADELAAADPKVTVIHRQGKEGLGAAYLAGFRWALDQGYDAVVEMDADGSHRPEDLPAMLEAAKDADLVIEAVPERLEIKESIFTTLDGIVREDCVLATNTSSLSITEMAADLKHPERVVGFHFFNPVAVMPLLEIIPGERTDDAALATLRSDASTSPPARTSQQRAQSAQQAQSAQAAPTTTSRAAAVITSRPPHRARKLKMGFIRNLPAKNTTESLVPQNVV